MFTHISLWGSLILFLEPIFVWKGCRFTLWHTNCMEGLSFLASPKVFFAQLFFLCWIISCSCRGDMITLCRYVTLSFASALCWWSGLGWVAWGVGCDNVPFHVQVHYVGGGTACLSKVSFELFYTFLPFCTFQLVMFNNQSMHWMTTCLHPTNTLQTERWGLRRPLYRLPMFTREMLVL